MVEIKMKINEDTNSILSIVKEQHGLKNKSEALEFIVSRYEDTFFKIRPEYAAKLERLSKEKSVKFKDLEEFRKIVRNAKK